MLCPYSQIATPSCPLSRAPPESRHWSQFSKCGLAGFPAPVVKMAEFLQPGRQGQLAPGQRRGVHAQVLGQFGFTAALGQHPCVECQQQKLPAKPHGASVRMLPSHLNQPSKLAWPDGAGLLVQAILLFFTLVGATAYGAPLASQRVSFHRPGEHAWNRSSCRFGSSQHCRTRRLSTT
jgi:hypothetical protein